MTLPFFEPYRGHERRDSYAAQPHDHDGVAILRLARIDHRAAAGQDRTPQGGGGLGRKVGSDLDDAGLIDHGMGREGGDANVVVDVAVVRIVDPDLGPASGKETGVVGLETAAARKFAVGPTVLALAAPGQEDGDHSVTRLEARNPLTDLLDDAGPLVPQEHRHRTGSVAVHNGEVRMAHSGRRHAQQDLAFLRRIQLEFSNLERARLREGGLGIGCGQYGAANLHVGSSGRMRTVSFITVRRIRANFPELFLHYWAGGG
jgi:hypothetical protein